MRNFKFTPVNSFSDLIVQLALKKQFVQIVLKNRHKTYDN